ncbi:MAG: CCA tRNA nucleotidyltransferase [Hyphomicrobiaceae bacterium]
MPNGPKLPSLAGADWLTAEPTCKVFAAFRAAGVEARAVGGVVRNALMGLPVTDIDIATPAVPDDVMRLARDAGLGVAETGLKHGTVTVIADHHPFEVTTLRIDKETHGRNATVSFTTDWEADARRRDFTMNALYCDADGTVYDPLGGAGDLLARRVRFIGDARARIREDYLRILRFFRFTAQYADGRPDMEGTHACVIERKGLARLSAERIHQELMRLLAAPHASAAVRAMQAWGILAEVLPAAPRPALLERLVAIEASQGLGPDSVARLAMLAVETDEDAMRLAARFRMSGAERAGLRLAALPEARLHSAPDAREARGMLYRAPEPAYRRLLLMCWTRALDAPADDGSWAHALLLPQRWTVPVLPVNGGDAMARGVPPGPVLGETLKALEAWWIANNFTPTREQLLKRLDEMVQSRGSS